MSRAAGYSMIGLETADSNDEQVTRLGDLAEHAALAFQLKDDLLGMMGSEDELGKPVGSDLKRGKKTVLFLVTLQRLNDSQRNEMIEILGKSDIQPQDVQQARKLILKSGAVDEVETEIRDLTNKSRILLSYFPENHYRKLLSEWLNVIIDRAH